MAQREQSKAKRAKARAIASDSPAERGAALVERCQALERERDQLKAELEAARAEIARLERSRAEVVNRIDWVIDSLHNILEGER